MRHFITILLVLISAAHSLYAQDISRQEEKKRQIEEEIALIDKQLDANRDKREQSLNTLLLTRRKMEARQKLIDRLDDDIASYNRSIADAGARIKHLNARLDTLRKYHEDMILSAYKTRDNKVWFMYILASKDLNQGLRRWTYLKNISESIRLQASQIQDTERELQEEKLRLENLKAGSVATRTERQKEKNTLAAEEKKMNSMVVQLTKNEKSLKKELQQKQKEVRESWPRLSGSRIQEKGRRWITPCRPNSERTRAGCRGRYRTEWSFRNSDRPIIRYSRISKCRTTTVSTYRLPPAATPPLSLTEWSSRFW